MTSFSLGRSERHQKVGLTNYNRFDIYEYASHFSPPLHKVIGAIIPRLKENTLRTQSKRG